jgi:hypothetical protein
MNKSLFLFVLMFLKISSFFKVLHLYLYLYFCLLMFLCVFCLVSEMISILKTEIKDWHQRFQMIVLHLFDNWWKCVGRKILISVLYPVILIFVIFHTTISKVFHFLCFVCLCFCVFVYHIFQHLHWMIVS